MGPPNESHRETQASTLEVLRRLKLQNFRTLPYNPGRVAVNKKPTATTERGKGCWGWVFCGWFRPSFWRMGLMGWKIFRKKIRWWLQTNLFIRRNMSGFLAFHLLIRTFRIRGCLPGISPAATVVWFMVGNLGCETSPSKYDGLCHDSLRFDLWNSGTEWGTYLHQKHPDQQSNLTPRVENERRSCQKGPFWKETNHLPTINFQGIPMDSCQLSGVYHHFPLSTTGILGKKLSKRIRGGDPCRKFGELWPNSCLCAV